MLFYNQEGFYILPIVILAGAIGGMLYASIPAILKTYFNTNEILVSLMLVYVSKLILDYLVVGPWSNPEGFNFPETRQFSDSARLPLLFEGLRIHAGIFLALAAVVMSWFIFYKTYLGFQMKVSGFSLKTAKYAGYKGKKMIILVFLMILLVEFMRLTFDKTLDKSASIEDILFLAIISALFWIPLDKFVGHFYSRQK